MKFFQHTQSITREWISVDKNMNKLKTFNGLFTYFLQIPAIFEQ